MEVLYPRCAGLDVYKETVVACVRIAADRAMYSEVRTFDTMTPGLLALADWLAEQGCTHVAMEARRATGSRSGKFCQTATSPWSWPRGVCQKRVLSVNVVEILV